MMSTADPVPRKKKSFLRRLSLSTSSSARAQVHARPPPSALPAGAGAGAVPAPHGRSVTGPPAAGAGAGDYGQSYGGAAGAGAGASTYDRERERYERSNLGQGGAAPVYPSRAGAGAAAPGAYRPPVREMGSMTLSPGAVSPTAALGPGPGPGHGARGNAPVSANGVAIANGTKPIPASTLASTSAATSTSTAAQRGRIHPALASPPNSPPKRSSYSPYDTRHIVRNGEDDGHSPTRSPTRGMGPGAAAAASVMHGLGQSQGGPAQGQVMQGPPIRPPPTSPHSQLPSQPQPPGPQGAPIHGPPRRSSQQRSQSGSGGPPPPTSFAPPPQNAQAHGSRFVESISTNPALGNEPTTSKPVRPSINTSLSEASKYALSIQPTRSHSLSPSTSNNTISPTRGPGPRAGAGAGVGAGLQRQASRPLPRPPSQSHSLSKSPSHPGSGPASPNHLAPAAHGPGYRPSSGPGLGAGSGYTPTASPSTAAAPKRSASAQPQSTSPHSPESYPSFDFARSPTLPQLVDPRRPPRGRPARLTFTYLFSITRIQRTLLPYLDINSFLAVLGTTERVRKAFTGEMVGKWVLAEWGIRLDGERGRSWPNLTVWEGYLESQLHDPSTYSTYPAQWHKLLQHLCLSYSLIVLYLRSLPPSALPAAAEEEEERPRDVRNDRLVEIVMPSPLSGSGQQRRRTSTGPPLSYPTPKRYNFRSDGSARSRRSSDSRPGSLFSYQSTPSVAPSVPRHRLIRDSVASDPGRRIPSPAPRRIEPIFDRAPPYVTGRAAVCRVFVPLSERVPRWPSAEGAFHAVKELEKCGALKKLRMGDLIANTAIRSRTTEHILLYLPDNKHKLVPLDYSKSPNGHLPAYVNAFSLPPIYHYPLLSPIIVSPDLSAFAAAAMASLRLAYDHKDVVVSTGRASAKRFIHVTGFEVPEWGMVTLEAEGTGEGKAELERRLGYGDPARIERSPWEVIREKSMSGTVWLRCV